MHTHTHTMCTHAYIITCIMYTQMHSHTHTHREEKCIHADVHVPEKLGKPMWWENYLVYNSSINLVVLLFYLLDKICFENFQRSSFINYGEDADDIFVSNLHGYTN